ncbi:single-stranded DNA-binding protein [Ammonicoccus fulvus]|uniref:Single-stranded DNA-binding protein n=1 Tax=Ammonicoccus fulvus TaxID=3138240 RepID=A0ABZ3FLQ3_9ACTN
MDSIVSVNGRLGTNVDYRAGEDRKPYASFRLAYSPRLRRADGSWEDGPTNWVTVKCWNMLATNADMSLSKGQPVVVVGKLRVKDYANENGVVRYDTIIEAQSIGHDLNLGVSRYVRLERERVESDPAAMDAPKPEEGSAYDEDGPADDYTMEHVMEGYAEPVG